MVKILANGDIVPDDDPRANQSSERNNNARQRTANPQRGGIPRAQDYPQGAGVQQVSIFNALNQRLLAFGIPPWTVGDTVIEPIVSVGLLLIFLVFGVQGLLFGAILFAVSQWSSNGPPNFISRLFGTQPQQGNGASNRGGGGVAGRGGGGYRLGRD